MAAVLGREGEEVDTVEYGASACHSEGGITGEHTREG